MNHRKPQIWMAGALALGMLVGHSASNGAEAQSAKAKKTTQTSPAKAIADARCDQEARCGNIGEGKDYKSKMECSTQVRSKLQKDLNAFECPGGYDQKELNECLEEVRNESCGNPFDTLERVVSCRSSDICKATVDKAVTDKNVNTNKNVNHAP